MLNCIDTSPKASTWRSNTHLPRRKLHYKNILWLQHVWVDKKKSIFTLNIIIYSRLGYSCITHVNSFFSYSASTSSFQATFVSVCFFPFKFFKIFFSHVNLSLLSRDLFLCGTAGAHASTALLLTHHANCIVIHKFPIEQQNQHCAQVMTDETSCNLFPHFFFPFFLRWLVVTNDQWFLDFSVIQQHTHGTQIWRAEWGHDHGVIPHILSLWIMYVQVCDSFVADQALLFPPVIPQ